MWSDCICSLVDAEHKYGPKQASQLMRYCENQWKTFTLTAFPSICHNRTFVSLLSRTAHHINKVKTKCVLIPEVQSAVCFKLRLKGCSIWQSPKWRPPPLSHPCLLCSAGYIAGRQVEALTAIAEWQRPDQLDSFEAGASGAARGLLRHAGVCHIGGGVLQYLNSFWLMDLSLPLSEQLSEGRQSRSSL